MQITSMSMHGNHDNDSAKNWDQTTSPSIPRQCMHQEGMPEKIQSSLSLLAPSLQFCDCCLCEMQKMCMLFVFILCIWHLLHFAFDICCILHFICHGSLFSSHKNMTSTEKNYFLFGDKLPRFSQAWQFNHHECYYCSTKALSVCHTSGRLCAKFVGYIWQGWYIACVVLLPVVVRKP